jgi:hypothetical protein
VRRRKFIAVLGGAAALWPLAGQAQQPERVRRIDALMPFPQNDPVTQASVTAFAGALGHVRWVEGEHIWID